MKFVLIFTLLISFSFRLDEKKIKIEIDGNPSCLQSGQQYKMKIIFQNNDFYENLVLKGKGVQIVKDYEGGDYKIKASDVFEQVSIIVSYKDSTSKVIDLDTFVLDVCRDTLKN